MPGRSHRPQILLSPNLRTVPLKQAWNLPKRQIKNAAVVDVEVAATAGKAKLPEARRPFPQPVLRCRQPPQEVWPRRSSKNQPSPGLLEARTAAPSQRSPWCRSASQGDRAFADVLAILDSRPDCLFLKCSFAAC